MRARDLLIPPDTEYVLVRPWFDPVVDRVGYDPRSPYVERFWLGVLGPSVTWLLRYLVGRLEAEPDGFDLELDECAKAIGLGRLQGPNAAFPRTLHRACQFGTARLFGGTTFEVRRKLPPLPQRQLARLPEALRAEHAQWVDGAPPEPAGDELRDRARRLALSLVELGEDREGTERQLHRWRFEPALAADATTWALDRHARPAAHGGVTAGDAVPDATTDVHSDAAAEVAGDATGPASVVAEPADEVAVTAEVIAEPAGTATAVAEPADDVAVRAEIVAEPAGTAPVVAAPIGTAAAG
jgi:hypothetical protein